MPGDEDGHAGLAQDPRVVRQDAHALVVQVVLVEGEEDVLDAEVGRIEIRVVHRLLDGLVAVLRYRRRRHFLDGLVGAHVQGRVGLDFGFLAAAGRQSQHQAQGQHGHRGAENPSSFHARTLLVSNHDRAIGRP